MVLDRSEAELASRPASRLLCTFRQGVYSLTLEQWLTRVKLRALAVSATVVTEEYPRLADLLSEIVASFEVRGA